MSQLERIMTDMSLKRLTQISSDSISIGRWFATALTLTVEAEGKSRVKVSVMVNESLVRWGNDS